MCSTSTRAAARLADEVPKISMPIRLSNHACCGRSTSIKLTHPTPARHSVRFGAAQARSGCSGRFQSNIASDRINLIRVDVNTKTSSYLLESLLRCEISVQAATPAPSQQQFLSSDQAPHITATQSNKNNRLLNLLLEAIHQTKPQLLEIQPI